MCQKEPLDEVLFGYLVILRRRYQQTECRCDCRCIATCLNPGIAQPKCCPTLTFCSARVANGDWMKMAMSHFLRRSAWGGRKRVWGRPKTTTMCNLLY